MGISGHLLRQALNKSSRLCKNGVRKGAVEVAKNLVVELFRNELGSEVAALSSHGEECVESLVESPFVAGLVAEQDGEGGRKFAGLSYRQGFALQMDGAVSKPLGFDHVRDEEDFGGGARFMLGG